MSGCLSCGFVFRNPIGVVQEGDCPTVHAPRLICNFCFDKGNFRRFAGLEGAGFVKNFRFGQAIYCPQCNWFYSNIGGFECPQGHTYYIPMQPNIPELPSQPQERTSMRTLSNYSLAIFLINDDVQAVRCAYQTIGAGNDESPADGKTYIFKTFDKTLKKGDIVIVPTHDNHRGVGFTCVKVWETNVDVDFNASHDFKWIVGRIDPEHYNMIVAKEAQAIEIVKNAEKKRMRDELRKDVMGYREEVVGQLQQITFNGNGSAISEGVAQDMRTVGGKGGTSSST